MLVLLIAEAVYVKLDPPPPFSIIKLPSAIAKNESWIVTGVPFAGAVPELSVTVTVFEPVGRLIEEILAIGVGLA